MSGDDQSDSLDEIKYEVKQQRIEAEKRQIERRTENVQVLFSLAVIGATATFLTGDSLITQEIEFINNIYWDTIFIIFLISNLTFLFMKLVTLPVRNYFGSASLQIFHKLVEPMLYSFTILGLGTAVLIGGVLEFLEVSRFIISERWSAILLMLLPFVASIIISMYVRINEIKGQFVSEYEKLASNIGIDPSQAGVDEELVRLAKVMVLPSRPLVLRFMKRFMKKKTDTFGEKSETAQQRPSEWTFGMFLRDNLDNIDDENVDDIERMWSKLDDNQRSNIMQQMRQDLRRMRETGGNAREYRRKQKLLNTLYEYESSKEKED